MTTMDEETRNELESLKGSVSNLQKSVDTLAENIGAIQTALAAQDTTNDELSGRIESNERTTAAIGDAVAAADLGAVADIAAGLAELRAGVNAFHRKVFQEPLFMNEAVAPSPTPES
jgi:chromosome segregation ATPase